MRAQFFRHLIGGIAIGTAFGAVALAGMAWVIQPHTTSLPLSFAFVGLFQVAAMGGVFGVATFLRAILDEDAPGSSDNGGNALPVDDAPVIEPDIDDAGLLPQPA